MIRLLLFSIIFLFGLNSSFAVTDTLFVSVTGLHNQKIFGAVTQGLSSVQGVTVSGFCEKVDVLVILVNRTLQPSDAEISNTLLGLFDGRLTWSLKNATPGAFTAFKLGCDNGYKLYNTTGEPDNNHTE